jgi:AhpD family alkylhydroperoxidase
MDLEIDYYALAESAMAGLEAVGDYLETESNLDPALVELVKLRASQINGCAHCMEVHTERLEELGEESNRIRVLPAWEESTYFTGREQAALAWTEVVTRIAEGIPDAVRRVAHEEFTDQELVDLTLAIGAINVYNRLAICFREPVHRP